MGRFLKYGPKYLERNGLRLRLWRVALPASADNDAEACKSKREQA
jgi:hypothetical protein